jgi:hypothetical protein
MHKARTGILLSGVADRGDTVGVSTAPEPVQHWWSVRQAAPAIYGTIIGASVLAATEENTPIAEVAATVVITLLVYWLAERWSFLLGHHLTGEPIDFAHAREVFAEGFSMVQASYVPLVVMLLSWGFGAGENLAVNLALLATLVVLVLLGVVAGRRSGLRGWGLLGGAVFTGALGVLLILLKSLLHH